MVQRAIWFQVVRIVWVKDSRRDGGGLLRTIPKGYGLLLGG